MSVFETIYMLNETSNLVGQMMFDMVSIIFAILVTGFVLGDKMNKMMLTAITIFSAAWVFPMLMAAYDQFGVMVVLSSTLTTDQLHTLEGLQKYIGAGSTMNSWSTLLTIILAHAGTYLGSIWFLFYCSKRPGYFYK